MASGLLLATVLCLLAPPEDLPTVVLTKDDTVIARSSRVVIPPGTVIADENGDGVIHVGASDIVIEFAEGSVLRGSPPDTRPDEYRGYGIRLNGHQNVTVRNARISGFWCGLWATDAAGLVLDGIDASDNRRAHLKSTPAAEDTSDWLYPQNDDDNEWLNNYGAALYIEDSDGVTVRNCKVWHGQNGLCLDRVSDAKIYDNDFSFNSGWGIALWRSSRNVISRNACDFCVRGYSHGVYNRGQDSAGILMFEQNNENVIAENSATHGGDCFFGFAGKEALGEAGEHPAEWYQGRGNDKNLLFNNDFSYAPAHGIEMTFSFGNVFMGNRMVENAICGVWGGYSHDTLIAKNEFDGNGAMGYGLERGGVDIEHGSENRILENTFKDNVCGVHLWWDPDGDLGSSPWAKANGTDSVHNLIAGNTFAGDKLAMHFRLVRDPADPSIGANQAIVGDNHFDGVGKEIEADEGCVIKHQKMLTIKPIELPDYLAYGDKRPVGARPDLRGRANIIMTEWGPWDHTSPLVRLIADTGDSVTYELCDMPATPKVQVEPESLAVVRGPASKGSEGPNTSSLTIKAEKPGVWPYTVRITAGDAQQELRGTLINTSWHVTFFKWTPDTDPREHLAAWRKLATSAGAVSVETGQLKFKYGWGGPSDLGLSKALTAAKLGGDHFGMIATTRLPLTAGKWRFTTTSDDGVRVIVDGQPVIDNWTWHGPTRDAGVFDLAEDKTVEITVEHFEIDGYAVLELGISRGQ